MEHIFFTGAPGFGKSALRSYVAWRQIQDTKQNEKSSIIWMSKSPREESSTEIIFIGK
jgi:hypothetical protein